MKKQEQSLNCNWRLLPHYRQPKAVTDTLWESLAHFIDILVCLLWIDMHYSWLKYHIYQLTKSQQLTYLVSLWEIFSEVILLFFLDGFAHKVTQQHCFPVCFIIHNGTPPLCHIAGIISVLTLKSSLLNVTTK